MIRFRTDSPVIALRAEMDAYYEMSHMARNGSAGDEAGGADPAL
ncbi:MAG: hypothetical protein WCV67_08930 [Victivallaceae bacterium]|jgi:hypothetical protein